MTLWMPAGTYIANDHRAPGRRQGVPRLHRLGRGHRGADRDASRRRGRTSSRAPTLPDDVLPAVQDLQAYIDGGNDGPALEFLSPVKGPNLEQITVEVGSGLTQRRGRRCAVRRGRREAGPATRPAGLVTQTLHSTDTQAGGARAGSGTGPGPVPVPGRRAARSAIAARTRTGSTCPSASSSSSSSSSRRRWRSSTRSPAGRCSTGSSSASTTSASSSANRR